MDILLNNRQYVFDETLFSAKIKRARLTLGGIHVLVVVDVSNGRAVPDHILLCVGETLVAQVPPNKTPECGADELAAVFNLDIEVVPWPLDCNFKVYAVNNSSSKYTAISGTPDAMPLLAVRIHTESDFARLIQNPATRMKDESTLLYAAIHSLTRFPKAYAVRAGAVCIIGYRLIHAFQCEDKVNDIFDSASRLLLEKRSGLPIGPEMRWVISVRLVIAYVELKRRHLEAAERQFREIASWGGFLAAWPSSLTNLLLAQYGLAFLALKRGDRSLARELFRGGESLFRFGASVAEFRNVYSYGELGNAIIVARECGIGQIISAAGSDSIQDPNLATPGTTLDPRVLPAPLGWLL